MAEEYGGDASRLWSEAADGDDLPTRIEALPGFGEMKVKALGAVLSKRFGSGRRMASCPPIRPLATSTPRRRSRTIRRRSAPTRRRSAPASRTSGDRAPDAPDGGQTAATLAEDVGTFLDGARQTLDLALYDLRLKGPEADRIQGALVGASTRGVRVRFLYNIDHPGPIPVPPPPESVSDLIESLPFETRAISGVPDLMHHKYVVRDGSAVLFRLDELDRATRGRGRRT